MSDCEECREAIQAVPFQCSTCGATLCPEHRLRERHACTPEVRGRRVRP